MLTTFNATLLPMLVMFMCILIGYALSKLKLVPPDTPTVLSRLEYYVLGTTLSLNTLSKNCTLESLSKEYVLILYGASAALISIGLAYLLVRFFAKEGYEEHVYRYALAFGNFGYMGQPVILALFGDEMLYRYIIFCVPLSLLVSTWGIAILIPTKATKAKFKFLNNIIKFPTIITLVGVIIGVLRIRRFFPEFAVQTLNNLGGCMGPIAMLLLGVVVGQYDLKKLLLNKKVYFVSLLRLLILPSVLVALFALFNTDKTTLTLILFAFAVPLGLNTVIYPASSGHDTSIGASMAIISHTLSIITIPIVYSLLTVIFK